MEMDSEKEISKKRKLIILLRNFKLWALDNVITNFCEINVAEKRYEIVSSNTCVSPMMFVYSNSVKYSYTVVVLNTHKADGHLIIEIVIV